MSPSSFIDTPAALHYPPVQISTPRGARHEHGHRVIPSSYVVGEVQTCLIGSMGMGASG